MKIVSYDCKTGSTSTRAMTAEEIAAMQAEQRKAELMERSRPLTEQEVSRMLLEQQINTLAVDDNTALRMREFYPAWAAGQTYADGYKLQSGGRLWRVLQSHTAQAGWEPENVPALFTEICETHAGTEDDPIPYSGNMALEEGLYYHEDYVLYRCTRSTGAPVYHKLRELVGIYVEVAA